MMFRTLTVSNLGVGVFLDWEMQDGGAKIEQCNVCTPRRNKWPKVCKHHGGLSLVAVSASQGNNVVCWSWEPSRGLLASRFAEGVDLPGRIEPGGSLECLSTQTGSHLWSMVVKYAHLGGTMVMGRRVVTGKKLNGTISLL